AHTPTERRHSAGRPRPHRFRGDGGRLGGRGERSEESRGRPAMRSVRVGVPVGALPRARVRAASRVALVALVSAFASVAEAQVPQLPPPPPPPGSRVNPPPPPR